MGKGNYIFLVASFCALPFWGTLVQLAAVELPHQCLHLRQARQQNKLNSRMWTTDWLGWSCYHLIQMVTNRTSQHVERTWIDCDEGPLHVANLCLLVQFVNHCNTVLSIVGWLTSQSLKSLCSCLQNQLDSSCSLNIVYHWGSPSLLLLEHVCTFMIGKLVELARDSKQLDGCQE
jgi:hypothetical protein